MLISLIGTPIGKMVTVDPGGVMKMFILVSIGSLPKGARHQE